MFPNIYGPLTLEELRNGLMGFDPDNIDNTAAVIVMSNLLLVIEERLNRLEKTIYATGKCSDCGTPKDRERMDCQLCGLGYHVLDDRSKIAPAFVHRDDVVINTGDE